MSKKEEIIELLRSTEREGVEDLIKFLEDRKYFDMPASTRYHGNYKGGLADHCYNLFIIFTRFNAEYHLNVPHNSCIIAAFGHDLCKASLYDGTEETGYKSNYFVGKNGHAKYSIARLERFIKLTDLEKQMIKFHMGYYGTKEFDGPIRGEFTIKELCTAQNNVAVKLFYFADDLAAQCLDKTKDEIRNREKEE